MVDVCRSIGSRFWVTLPAAPSHTIPLSKRKWHNGLIMTIFVDGDFTAHSGGTLGFKIECDVLSAADLATLARQFSNSTQFGAVVSVPRGGDRFADALRKYCTSGPTLIVDDVLTTGRSMEQAAKNLVLGGFPGSVIGVVIFARGSCPKWITPLFRTFERDDL